MPSAQFQIDTGSGYGPVGVAQDALPGATVQCRIVDVTGINPGLIAWRIFGTDGSPDPVLALSGIPNGEIVTFTLPAGAGQSYGVSLDVNGGEVVTGDATTTAKSAVYVLNDSFQRPFFVGETFEGDSVYGIIPRLNYLQSWVSLDYKESVRVATAAALPANTRTTNTLTASANGALTVDGIAMAVGYRALIKDEAAGANNGIYSVDDPGSAGDPWIMTRSKLSDESIELQSGSTTYAEEGVANAEKVYRLITPPPIVLNTTPLVFAVSMVAGASGPAGGDLAGTYPNPEVAAIHETAGPTQLTIGAIVDGEHLVRNGLLIESDPGGGPPSGGAGGDLGGTYPNPSVAAITETAGPTQLTVGAIVDGEHLVRNGLLIESDPGGGPPTGGAGGDLGGTYPNPSVAAITETSGPTSLVAGAIATGEILVRSGGTLIGQVGAAPSGSASGDLAGTYPSPEVAAITESGSGTQLTIGLVSDTEVLVRSGATVISEPRVYGLDRVYAESLPVTTSTATAFTTKVALVHPAVGPGTYQINWCYGWNHNSTGNDYLCQITNGGGIIYVNHVAEPADSGGAGPGGTNQRYYSGGFFDVVYGVATADTFTMQFATSVAGVSSAIFDARLEFIRVA